MFDFEVPYRHQNRDPGSREEQIEKVKREVIDQHGVHQAIGARSATLIEPALDVINRLRGKQQPDERRDRVRPLLLFRQHEVDQEYAEREHREQSDGQGQQVISRSESERGH